MTILSFFVIFADEDIWPGVLGFVFFGASTLVFIFEKQVDAWTESKRENEYKSKMCQIHSDHFLFPKGYYYRFGLLKDRKQLPFDWITEIRTNTFPPTAIVQNKEAILLQGLTKKDITQSEHCQHLNITEPLDNWSLICEVFLDTEVSKEEDDRILILLENNGIPREEVTKIRKRLKVRMLLRTYYSMEWMYYGQYDVLGALSPLNAKKYQWIMDIALRK